VGLKRLQVARDRLLDVDEGLVLGVPLADTPGQVGRIDRIATVWLRLEHDIELVGLLHVPAYGIRLLDQLLDPGRWPPVALPPDLAASGCLLLLAPLGVGNASRSHNPAWSRVLEETDGARSRR
jgi:hypothetical protein